MSPDASWSLASGSLLALALCVGLYAWRWTSARRDSGPGAASVRRLLCFAAGTVVVAVALVSPVNRLGEQLFLMHMTQHVLLINLASILLLCGLTREILAPAMRGLPGLRAVLADPIVAVLLYTGTLLAWHAPPLYEAALQSSLIHAVQHLNFAAAGLLFWWHIVSPVRSPGRLAGPSVALYFAGAKVINGALAMAIVFWPTVLYPLYAGQGPFWGLTVLEDQELGGAVLLIEASLLLVVGFIATFLRMLGESEQEERRKELLDSLP